VAYRREQACGWERGRSDEMRMAGSEERARKRKLSRVIKYLKVNNVFGNKETGSGDPGIFLWCTFPKVFDLGLLCVFRFVELAKEGFVECLADIHASSDQFVEDRPDTGDDPTGLGFSEYLQTSHHSNALVKGFPSGFTLINEEDRSLLFGQRDRLAFSQMEFWGQPINKRAVTHGKVPNPRDSLHLCRARFPSAPDHDLLIHSIWNGKVSDDLMEELQSVGARTGEDRALVD
jgi:hypothetical protein